MDLAEVLSVLAAFERRAIMLYRAYAERFSANPAVSRLWWEMFERVEYCLLPDPMLAFRHSTHASIASTPTNRMASHGEAG